MCLDRLEMEAAKMDKVGELDWKCAFMGLNVGFAGSARVYQRLQE